MPPQTQPTTRPEKEDDTVVVEYTDPTKQFVDEMRMRLGMMSDKEIAEHDD